jgi:hypothetical protein
MPGAPQEGQDVRSLSEGRFRGQKRTESLDLATQSPQIARIRLKHLG